MVNHNAPWEIIFIDNDFSRVLSGRICVLSPFLRNGDFKQPPPHLYLNILKFVLCGITPLENISFDLFRSLKGVGVGAGFWRMGSFFLVFGRAPTTTTTTTIEHGYNG